LKLLVLKFSQLQSLKFLVQLIERI